MNWQNSSMPWNNQCHCLVELTAHHPTRIEAEYWGWIASAYWVRGWDVKDTITSMTNKHSARVERVQKIGLLPYTWLYPCQYHTLLRPHSQEQILRAVAQNKLSLELHLSILFCFWLSFLPVPLSLMLCPSGPIHLIYAISCLCLH